MKKRPMIEIRVRAARARQRGAVLIISLVILVVLLSAGVALVRSVDTTMLQAGNLAFKRDLMNQAERVVPVVIEALSTGALATPAARAGNREASNYSAVVLASTPQGIPRALLLDDAAFDALPYAAVANDIVVAGQGVRIRYVIDRLSIAAGEESVLGDGYVQQGYASPRGRSGSQLRRSEEASAAAPSAAASGPPAAGAITAQAVYRVSLRVSGPRDTQAFLQSTLTR